VNTERELVRKEFVTMAFYSVPTFLIGFLAAFISAETAMARSKAKPTYVAEISPLRTAMGAPEMRLETVDNTFGVALKWNQERRPSSRADYTDQSQILRVEGVWYPLGVTELPVFLGMGLQHEHANIGRQQERSHMTWARTSSDEAYDRWVNQDTYLSMTQSVGYRYMSQTLLTASISAYRDELIIIQSRNEDTSEIYSSSPDLDTKSRAKLITGVTLSIGLYFR